MVKIKNIEKGLFPFGSGLGMFMGKITFECDDEKVEDLEKAGKELVDSYESLVKDKKMESLIESWYCGDTYFMICETGEGFISSETNLPLFDKLYYHLSKKSFETSKGLLRTTLVALPIGFVGSPKEYTGSNQFYERFNLIYVTQDNGNSFDQLAEVEALRIPNSSLVVWPKTKEDVDNVFTNHIRMDKLPHLSSKYVAAFPQYEGFEEVIDYAAERGLRVSFDFSNKKGFLKF